MMRTKIQVLILVLSTLATYAVAQDKVKENLSSAQGSYGSGDLEDARFKLQQTLAELDVVIGKEILKILPTKMGDMEGAKDDEPVSGSSVGFAGLFVGRDYKNETDPETSIRVEVANNSPMLSMVNTFLSSTLLTAMVRNENQKVVKVDGYKSMLQLDKDEETGKTRCTISVPFGNSLMTFTYENMSSESEAVALANTVNVKEIERIAR